MVEDGGFGDDRVLTLMARKCSARGQVRRNGFIVARNVGMTIPQQRHGRCVRRRQGRKRVWIGGVRGLGMVSSRRRRTELEEADGRCNLGYQEKIRRSVN